ncbi:hypothetical protein M426DRAFT_53158 [Hypoxylon sp. CI-4A]|nr:hypothetical protein M426DRAFT_53158 [Hypoxylon sp. CI-4A]
MGSRSAKRRSYLRSSSQSPTRQPHRLGDDLLAQLSPNVAVDALRSPTGALKQCMDRASVPEQAFAMRTAIASKKIRDWLDELTNWPWPKDSGSAGFEMPPAKRRKLLESDTSDEDDHNGKLPEPQSSPNTDYLGSLPATDVEHYEVRIDRIQQELDGLDLEEIKNQVLHNHILPLSRPNSPFSEGGRSVSSVSMYTKMEDLTAVVTAITVQALPNLSRLSRLLSTWNMRFLVLRKVPSLLMMIKDAEVTLRSGWSAIESPDSSPTRLAGRNEGAKVRTRPKLSRGEYNIIKNVIQQKITKPGRALDYMLDLLEGSTDTLPDEWLDRMEKVERDYAVWETAAERKLRADSNFGLLESPLKNVPLTEPETPQPKIHIEGPSPTRETHEPDSSMELDLPHLPDPDEPFSSDAISPPSSPPFRYKTRSTSVTFKDVPEIAPLPKTGSTPPESPLDPPEVFDADASFDNESQFGSPGRMSSVSSANEDDHLQQQISEILESVPAKISLKRTPGVNLNPPDFQPPSRPKSKVPDNTRRSGSSLSSRAGTPSSFSRSGTPSFMLAPARDTRPRTKSSQGIRVYHLSRSTGEPPLKLLIRGVGEKGERVMVRIGGGWADLGVYLREYALHHGSRSKGEGKVDIRDAAGLPGGVGSSPSSRPGSAMDSPVTPLFVRKTRKSLGEESAPRFPKTPFAYKPESETPPSEHSLRSRASSSRLDWDEEDSALGLAGPKGKKVDMSDESRAWVESVKEKVRIASGERVAPPEQRLDTKFGEIGRVGGTKRLFRKN